MSDLTSTSDYFIFKNENGETVQNLVETTTESMNIKGKSIAFHQIVSDFILTYLFNQNILGKIKCRTFQRLSNDLLIQCTPKYNSTNGHWYDWVWINWEYDNGSTTIVPAQVYSIIDLRSIDDGHRTLKPGFCVCVRPLSKYPVPKWRNSKIIYSGSFE